MSGPASAPLRSAGHRARLGLRGGGRWCFSTGLVSVLTQELWAASPQDPSAQLEPVSCPPSSLAVFPVLPARHPGTALPAPTPRPLRVPAGRFSAQGTDCSWEVGKPRVSPRVRVAVSRGHQTHTPPQGTLTPQWGPSQAAVQQRSKGWGAVPGAPEADQGLRSLCFPSLRPSLGLGILLSRALSSPWGRHAGRLRNGCCWAWGSTASHPVLSPQTSNPIEVTGRTSAVHTLLPKGPGVSGSHPAVPPSLGSVPTLPRAGLQPGPT